MIGSVPCLLLTIYFSTVLGSNRSFSPRNIKCFNTGKKCTRVNVCMEDIHT